ncbi:unnamed protein product [Mesocestoides corti]|uniref:TLC domain-containing protein n=1 Tax=Mesocestoides corti TaxID=53468 RepID=A0A3P6HMB6_MESCO|nr:unnamed protein product [Mesocestoides corti]
MAKWAEFREPDIEKAPEGVFRSLYYCFVTVYGAYISWFSGKYNFIQQPCEVYTNQTNLGKVCAYFFVLIPRMLGYYLSGVYLELYMDKKRKDSTMMLMHHLVTIMLVYVSYIARYYYHGCIVFFLHDISDAILETGKYIVKMCIRLLTGKDKQVEDIREREMADSTGQYMNGTRLSKKAD